MARTRGTIYRASRNGAGEQTQSGDAGTHTARLTDSTMTRGRYRRSSARFPSLGYRSSPAGRQARTTIKKEEGGVNLGTCSSHATPNEPSAHHSQNRRVGRDSSNRLMRTATTTRSIAAREAAESLSGGVTRATDDDGDPECINVDVDVSSSPASPPSSTEGVAMTAYSPSTQSPTSPSDTESTESPSPPPHRHKLVLVATRRDGSWTVKRRAGAPDGPAQVTRKRRRLRVLDDDDDDDDGGGGNSDADSQAPDTTVHRDKAPSQSDEPRPEPEPDNSMAMASPNTNETGPQTSPSPANTERPVSIQTDAHTLQEHAALLMRLVEALPACLPSDLPSPLLDYATRDADHYRREVQCLERDREETRKKWNHLVNSLGATRQDIDRLRHRAAKWRSAVQRCEADWANLQRGDDDDSVDDGPTPDGEHESHSASDSDAEDRASSRRMRRTVLDAARESLEHTRTRAGKRETEVAAAESRVRDLERQIDELETRTAETDDRLTRTMGVVTLLEARSALEEAYVKVGRRLGLTTESRA